MDKKKISIKEKVWYGGCICAAVIGLAFIIMGIIGDNLSVNNAFRKIQSGFPWRYIGLIIVACAVVICLFVLLINAKKVDRVVDREQRRKLRLQAMLSNTPKDNDTLVVNEQGKIESNTNDVKTVDTNSENIDANKTIEEKKDSLDNAVISDEIKGE